MLQDDKDYLHAIVAGQGLTWVDSSVRPVIQQFARILLELVESPLPPPAPPIGD